MVQGPPPWWKPLPGLATTPAMPILLTSWLTALYMSWMVSSRMLSWGEPESLHTSSCALLMFFCLLLVALTCKGTSTLKTIRFEC